jgi:esterase
VTGTDAFVEFNGLRLHYREYADPKAAPLVLLHGVAMEAHGWDRFAADVGDRRRVLALTARGHGDSDRAAEYGVMQHVADTVGFIDAVVRGPAVVCGLSMGGGTAIGLAAMHPDKVAKLIVVEAGPPSPEGASRLAGALANSPESWRSYDEALPAFRAGYGGVADETLLAYMPHVLRRDADGRLRGKLDPNVVSARPSPDADRSQGEQLLWAACAAIKCPTLVVRGSRSDMLTSEGAQRMAGAIAGARLVEVDAGHVVPMENPEGFYDAVRGFI